jgi:hypothetical protein
MTKHSGFALLIVLAVLGACTTQPTSVPSGLACDTGLFVVLDDFIGARRGACDVIGPREVRLSMVREDDQVKNPSPWYAFKLVATEPATIRVTLDYENWAHRYRPKISVDGVRFSPAPDSMVASPSDNELALTLTVGTDPLWISAQQLLTPEDYERWLRNLAVTTGTTLTIAGRSLADLPVYKFESGDGRGRAILLTGRQHPPEVSGGVAMMAFLDALYDDSPLAVRFRDEFRVISLPLMNPDGVIAGHWRHNLGATDLNRDWGPFTQPETQIVQALLDELDADKTELVAFVDFHSTSRNLVYTQAEPTSPEGFSAIWLARSLARIRADVSIDYPFENEPRPASETANGKNYMYKRYAIPSLTYEVGDETRDSDNIAAAGIFAEEFMRLALERL